MMHPFKNTLPGIEARLIQNFIGGSAAAFSEIYDQVSGPLLQLILLHYKDRELANSVLEQTFLTAWKQRRSFDCSTQSLGSWLYRISRENTGNGNLGKTYSSVLLSAVV